MQKLILMHLNELLLAVSILTGTVALLAVRSVTQPTQLMTIPTPDSEVEDIITRYRNDQLAELDDVTLAKAADKLEYAHKHYFDGIVISQLSLKEAYNAIGYQRELRQIADSIWRLLSTRYGCND